MKTYAAKALLAFIMLLSFPGNAESKVSFDYEPIWQARFVELDEAYILEAAARPIDVPETFELASIILSLSEFGTSQLRIEPNDTELTAYIERVRQHFGPFADHPIVRKIDFDGVENWQRLYDFRENSYLYSFDDEGGRSKRLKHVMPYSHVWFRPDNTFTRNIELIEDFAEVSAFRQFYAENREFYDGLIARDTNAASITGMKSWLDERFDANSNVISAVYSPLFNGWHSTQIIRDGDRGHHLLFLQPGFPTSFERPDAWARMVFTEIDHGYVNPVSNRFQEQLNQEEGFGNAIWVDRLVPGTGAYENGYMVFNEYMTWALFELWATEAYNAETAQRIRRNTQNQMVDRGFPLFPEFSETLFTLYDERVARGGEVKFEALYPALIAWAQDQGR